MVSFGSINSLCVIVILASSASSLVFPSFHARTPRMLQALPVPDIPSGEREIVDGDDGKPIVIANVNGEYVACAAICPHLGLPMKKGKITTENGQPTITCSFHNSKFNMKTGKCTKWVTGALGTENPFVSGIMGKMGSPKADIRAYEVVTDDSGARVLQ